MPCFGLIICDKSTVEGSNIRVREDRSKNEARKWELFVLILEMEMNDSSFLDSSTEKENTVELTK